MALPLQEYICPLGDLEIVGALAADVAYLTGILPLNMILPRKKGGDILGLIGLGIFGYAAYVKYASGQCNQPAV